MKRQPRHTLRQCFFTGSNSSCRNHIRSFHYGEYKARCTAAKPPITLNQRCIPANVKAEERGKTTRAKQQKKLEFPNMDKPIEYSRDGVLDAVARHVACDNQVSQIVDMRYHLLCSGPDTYHRHYRFPISCRSEIAW